MKIIFYQGDQANGYGLYPTILDPNNFYSYFYHRLKIKSLWCREM